ncbi:MAG: tRNA adenosine(34) deaminase TadA [Rhodoferax sp.]
MTESSLMGLALVQARSAMERGEVPVGAVVARAGQVIALAGNSPIAAHDPSAHAEIIALRAAAQVLQNYRLDDCELYVTLEPCAMCAGAMLHARIGRVVFGAPDPKAGAAGSVLDLFANRQLNHRTQVLGGVMATQCAALLQEFFQRKRLTQRLGHQPLRDDALRTPVACFANLQDYPWQSHFVSDLPSLSGLRLHYLDEGPVDGAQTFLCLHGATGWSYFFRNIIPELLNAGHRVVAPDLIGFGKSDKIKKEAGHTLDWHLQVLTELVLQLDLKNVVLMLQDRGDALAAALPSCTPGRYAGQTLVAAATAVESSHSAYQAPYPDEGHRAALRSRWRRHDKVAS